MLELGKLYQVKAYCWLLYPSKESASDCMALSDGVDYTQQGDFYSAYWSEKLNIHITYISPKDILFPVETNGEYVKVISGEGVGWFVASKRSRDHYFQELKEE